MVACECLSGQRPFTGPPLVVALAHRTINMAPGAAVAFSILFAGRPGWYAMTVTCWRARTQTVRSRSLDPNEPRRVPSSRCYRLSRAAWSAR